MSSRELGTPGSEHDFAAGERAVYRKPPGDQSKALDYLHEQECVVREVKHNDLGVLYRVDFESGATIDAWPDELWTWTPPHDPEALRLENDPPRVSF